jgi:hypothetical protein
MICPILLGFTLEIHPFHNSRPGRLETYEQN